MQERLFGILHLLVLRGRMTTAELAAHFEVSSRTIRRDIDALCRSGVPLYAERGRGGGVQLVDGYVLDRSLLSRQEQVDLLAALQSLAAARYPRDGAVQDKLQIHFSIGTLFALWVLGLALLLRRKAYPFALVLAPGALLWLTLMLAAPVAFGVRYAYLLLAGFPLIPVVPVLAGNKNQQEEK